MFTQNHVQFVIDAHATLGEPLSRTPEIDSFAEENDVIEFGDFYVRQFSERVTPTFGPVYTRHTYDLYEWVPAYGYEGSPECLDVKIATGLRSLTEAIIRASAERHTWKARTQLDDLVVATDEVLQAEPF